MAIFVDLVSTHGTGGTGNDTVPPGITGLDWCHIVSTSDLLELTTFLTANILTVGQPATNVRTPALGSNCTYAGLTQAQQTAAIAAGAVLHGWRQVIAQCFDSSGTSTYEP